MSRGEKVGSPQRRRRVFGVTVLVSVAVGSTLVFGAASGRLLAQHGVGGAASARTAMSATQRLSHAGGRAALVSRGSAGAARDSISRSSFSSFFPHFGAGSVASPRLLAATGCG